jgi:nitric oxide dioxygenase
MYFKNTLKVLTMLDANTRALVKATAPVLKEHGVTLTSHFYQRMFRHNPELKNIFNQGHQAGGQQQQALASAVLAYAEHIDNPSVLMPVLVRVANKHVSLGIRAEHYPIVGHHLLASIREVMGEAATDELIAAWAAAYGQLADLLIAEEAKLANERAVSQGGWSGFRPFKVREVAQESAEINSFYLVPTDGGAVPAFKPGQYVTIKVYVPELGLNQPRQYSLSDAPNGRYLRISVKRESARNASPAGMVSNHLHDTLKLGDIVELTAPSGDFVLHEERATPVVLISGGVGQTPMQSMLNHLLTQPSQREIVFVHGCRHGEAHAFRDVLNRHLSQSPRLSKVVFYEQTAGHEVPGRDYDHIGLVDLKVVAAKVLKPQADYYLCGPLPFMRAQRATLLELGVPSERIHQEVFGSDPMNG